MLNDAHSDFSSERHQEVKSIKTFYAAHISRSQAKSMFGYWTKTQYGPSLFSLICSPQFYFYFIILINTPPSLVFVFLISDHFYMYIVLLIKFTFASQYDKNSAYLGNS